jgi:hypothetical protein
MVPRNVFSHGVETALSQGTECIDLWNSSAEIGHNPFSDTHII